MKYIVVLFYVIMKSAPYILVLVLALLTSCQEKATTANGLGDAHLGTWEMIYFQSISGTDTTEIKAVDSPVAVTLLTPTHFSYQWRNSANSGAGTYTYDGTVIHQKFDYVQDSSFAGAVLSFNMTVKNDTLTFSGPIKAVSPTGEDILSYIPQMLEIRTRSQHP